MLFIDPTKVELVTRSSLNNGFGSVQFTTAGGALCLALVSAPVDTCTLPPGTTNSLTGVGNILSLSGNAGNVSIGTFTNTLNASFTPETNTVPEPATYALLASGLAAIYRLRRR